MEELTKDYITIGINIVIALTAIAAVLFSRVLSKNQLRRGKLEDIFRLFNKLMYTYGSLFDLYISINTYHSSPEQRGSILEKYNKDREDFIKRFNVDALIEDYYTLDMLIKLYVKGKLKKDMMALCLLYIDLFDVGHNQQYIVKSIFWRDGFPNADKMNLLFRSLEENMIKDLGMSNKKSLYTREDIRKHCNNDLKKDLKMIKVLT